MEANADDRQLNESQENQTSHPGSRNRGIDYGQTVSG